MPDNTVHRFVVCEKDHGPEHALQQYERVQALESKWKQELLEAVAEEVNRGSGEAGPASGSQQTRSRVPPPRVPSEELSARLAARKDSSEAPGAEDNGEWPEWSQEAPKFEALPDEDWDVYGERAGQQTLDAAAALPEGTEAPCEATETYKFLEVCKLGPKECEAEYAKVVALYRVRAKEQAKLLKSRGYSPLKAHEDHEFLLKNRGLLTYQRDLEFRMAEFSLPTAKQVADWELPNEQTVPVAAVDEEATWADDEEEYDLEKDVQALEERAEEDDVVVEKIPAASEVYPLHSATTPVLTLISGYLERFCPGQTSYEVLSQSSRCRPCAS